MLKRLPRPLISFALIIGIISCGASIVSASTTAKVTYLASEAIYINAGTTAGLSVGDTLVVTRKSDTLATVVITSVSASSAACALIDSRGQVKVGDRLRLDSYEKAPAIGKSYESSKNKDFSPGGGNKGKAIGSRKRYSSSMRNQESALSGSLSLGNFYRKDQTGSKLSSNQTGLRSRIRIRNIKGSGIDFEMRHRTRLNRRARALISGSSKSELSHQVYAFGLRYQADSSSISWGVGRILAPHVRGMGYVDGGYVEREINGKLQVGIAAGVTPNSQNSSVQLNRQKLGVFARYAVGDAATQLITLTGSLTSETESFSVSRDFLYLQSRYSRSGWLSFTQSFELELNRGWRREASGRRFEFSNYYGTANVNLNNTASVYLSYDARKNIRRYDNIDTPDSLFDESTHRGVRGGFRLSPTKNLRFFGNLGVRIRQNTIGNNTFGTLGARFNRFPKRGHSLALRLSYVKTQFTTGYRPSMTYRFPLGRKTRVTVTSSAYTYNTGANTITNYYLDFGASHPLGSRYFFNGSYRQYFDRNLQSSELYTEIGLRL